MHCTTTSFDRLRDAWRSAGLRWRDTGSHSANAQGPGHSGWEVSARYIPPSGDKCGHTLIHSHNNEPYADVLAGVGLKPFDLYDDRRNPSWTYPDGLTMTKSWAGAKKLVTPSRRGTKAAGSPLLYSEDLDLARPIYLVAGESDAENVRRICGVQAVTNRFGEGTSHLADLTPLYGAQDLRIVLDDDDAGHRRGDHLVVALHERAAVTVWAPVEGCNDLTDHLADGHGIDDLVQLDVNMDVALSNVSDTKSDNVVDVSLSDNASDLGESGQSDTSDTSDTEVSELLSRICSAADLDAEEFDPIEYAVDGVLTEGLAFLAGPPKVGKSWLVGGIAYACAAGGSALGSINVDQRPVLYLALEDSPRRLQDRLRIIGGGQSLPTELDLFVDLVGWEKTIALIRAWIAKHADRKPLVVLDTFGKIKPQKKARDEGYLADYRFASELKNVADSVPGACILVVHHTRKGQSEDFLEDLSGTNGIAGAADTILVLRRQRTSNDGTLFVTGRDVEENAYAISIADGRWSLDGGNLNAAASVVTDREQQSAKSGDMVSVIAAVQQRWANTGNASTAADVTEAAFGRWENQSAAQRRAKDYLPRAVKAGDLVKVSRGLYEPTDAYKARHQSDNPAETTSVASVASVANPGNVQVDNVVEKATLIATVSRTDRESDNVRHLAEWRGR